MGYSYRPPLPGGLRHVLQFLRFQTHSGSSPLTPKDKQVYYVYLFCDPLINIPIVKIFTPSNLIIKKKKKFKIVHCLCVKYNILMYNFDVFIENDGINFAIHISNCITTSSNKFLAKVLNFWVVYAKILILWIHWEDVLERFFHLEFVDYIWEKYQCC